MSAITLKPGDVYVSRDGYTVRLLTPDEQRAIVARIREAIRRETRHPPEP